MTDLKIGFYDTEWSPTTTYTWSQRPKYIPNEMHIEDARMLCFGWRWLNQKRTKTWDERSGNREMLVQLRDLMSEADVLVGYNSDSFDNKKVNGLFAKHGIEPPSPYKSLDLYKVVKKNFSFYSGKLGFVADRIVGDTKVETGGFQLWKDVLAGDEKAWRKFLQYQRQDVDLLVDLYQKLLPWIKMPHPVSSGENKCRNCGGFNLQSRGKTVTLNGSYTRLHCQDCGKWQRGSERTSDTNIRDIS